MLIIRINNNLLSKLDRTDKKQICGKNRDQYLLGFFFI